MVKQEIVLYLKRAKRTNYQKKVSKFKNASKIVISETVRPINRELNRTKTKSNKVKEVKSFNDLPSNAKTIGIKTATLSGRSRFFYEK